MDHIIGLLLIGLGLRTPQLTPRPSVMGEQTETVSTSSSQTTLKPTGKREIKDQTEAAKNKIEQLKEQQKNLLETAKRERKNVREMLEDQEEFASRSMELLKRKKEEAEAYHKKIETLREEAKKKIEANKKTFQNRIAAFKDEKKREMLKKLDGLIATANANRVEAMTKQIEKLSEVLAKITTKTQELKSAGVDTSAVDTAVSAAQTAITAAKTAIETQAKKEYVIGVTTEADVSSDVGRTRAQLEKDLGVVRSAMIQARQSVSSAVSALALLAGSEEKTSDGSASTSGQKGL